MHVKTQVIRTQSVKHLTSVLICILDKKKQIFYLAMMVLRRMRATPAKLVCLVCVVRLCVRACVRAFWEGFNPKLLPLGCLSPVSPGVACRSPSVVSGMVCVCVCARRRLSLDATVMLNTLPGERVCLHG